MKKEEYGLAAAAFIVIFALGVVLLSWGHSLSNSLYFNVGANEIQWSSGPATLGAVVAFIWMRWHSRCAGTKLCLRHGEHPVQGTTKKVCHHHHTLEHHQLVHKIHHLEGRLGWGESHDPNNRSVEEPPSPTGPAA